jgi:prevent-host-death family protein
MHISVSDAKAQLTELVRRAEGGDEVILTRHGQPAVRLTPIRAAAPDAAARRSIIDRLSQAAQARATPGPSAEHSQDFLYDDNGLPK